MNNPSLPPPPSTAESENSRRPQLSNSPAAPSQSSRPISIPTSGNELPDIKSTVQNAVNRQLISDVPVGCFFCGIDSSVIAACLSGHKDIYTFSIGFEDPRYDETKYAAQVAAHSRGTTHHEFIVRPDAAADLPQLAAVFGRALRRFLRTPHALPRPRDSSARQGCPQRRRR